MKPLLRSKGLREYHQLNALGQRHGAVLFGSTFASRLHLSELAQDYSLYTPVYNRSIENLSVYDAGESLQTCVLDLVPDSIFVNLGDADLDFSDHTMEEVLGQYEWILSQIHSALRRCELYVVSVCSDHPNTAEFNRALRNLAKSAGCRYVDITSAAQSQRPELKAFSVLKGHLRRGISFADAMSMAPV